MGGRFELVYQVFLTLRDLYPVHNIQMCAVLSVLIEMTHKTVCQQTACEVGDEWSSATDGNVCTQSILLS